MHAAALSQQRFSVNTWKEAAVRKLSGEELPREIVVERGGCEEVEWGKVTERGIVVS